MLLSLQFNALMSYLFRSESLESWGTSIFGEGALVVRAVATLLMLTFVILELPNSPVAKVSQDWD